MDWVEIRNKLSSPYLWLGFLGAVKYFAQTLGYTIPDGTINDIANGVAGIVVVISIFKDHGKIPTNLTKDTQENTQVNG